MTTPDLSIVIPCFNEEQSLPACVAALDRYVASRPGQVIEVVFVDDGSTDGTWRLMQTLLASHPRWHAMRLMANRGSHIALRCGFRCSTGARVVNLPADLQEPIENIDRLWRAMDEQKVDGVLAVRQTRGDGFYTDTMSRVYHGALHYVNLKAVPVQGMSQFMVSRRVVQQINAHNDHGFTFEGFLASAPLKLAIIWYDRAVVVGRVSRWTFTMQVQHAMNTILSFSNVPIRALSVTGAAVAVVGLVYAAFVFFRFAIFGGGASGWPSLMTVVLVLGGLNLLALGLVGEYVWRILDESRRRPLYQIEDRIGFEQHDESDALAAVADGRRLLD
jgi:polyisoprenyl-phosphate glycosyltransferase